MRSAKKRRRPPYRPADTRHDPKKLGQAISRGGYLQKTFAARVGISESYMSELLAGQKSPSPPLMKRMAKVLGCTIEDLEKQPEDEQPEQVAS